MYKLCTKNKEICVFVMSYLFKENGKSHKSIMQELFTIYVNNVCSIYCIVYIVNALFEFSEGHLGFFKGIKKIRKHFTPFNLALRTHYKTLLHTRVNLSNGRVCAVLGWGSCTWETLRRPAIRHILPLAEGDGKGGFVALAFPHHVHTRDTKRKEKKTSRQRAAAQRDLTKTSHQTLHREKNHFFTHVESLDNLSPYFSATIKKKRGGFGEGVVHVSWRSYYRDPDFFMASFFGSWGEGRRICNFPVQLERHKWILYIVPSSPSAFSLLEDTFRGCWILDNERIRENPKGIGWEVQNEKVWKDCGKNFEASFSSPCRFGKLILNLMKKTTLPAFSVNYLSEVQEKYFFSSFFAVGPPPLPPPKMSSQSWSPIVGFYGMLCVWAAWPSGCGAGLSPNGTIFEDNCKKTTTCEALKYNTCLGSPLPYTHTSLILAEDSDTQEEAFEKLTMWSGK